MANTPNLKGKASEINDTKLLFERVGYRIFLMYRDGSLSPERIYKGHVAAELKRLKELHPRQ